MVNVVWEAMTVLAVLLAIGGLVYVLGLTGSIADDEDDDGPNWSGLAVAVLVAVFLAAMLIPLMM